jgi:hypothetical protein
MTGQRKSFLGSDAEEVDNQVDGWLAKSKVHGTNGARYGVGIAISIWYEPIAPQAKSGWSVKSGRA